MSVFTNLKKICCSMSSIGKKNINWFPGKVLSAFMAPSKYLRTNFNVICPYFDELSKVKDFYF